MTHRVTLVLPLLMMALIGCREQTAVTEVNFYNAGRHDLSRVTRVVFVELIDDTGYPRISERMTTALCQQLLRSGHFRVDIIPPTHPQLRYLDVNKREPYTISELAAIRKALNCDAILFGRMTSYQPYPSTQVGLYLRLLDLQDGKLAWAVDDVWDTTNRQTVERIKRYYFNHMAEDYQPVNYEMGIMSTDGFQKFVAFEVVETLNPAMAEKSQPLWYFMRRVGRHQENFWSNVREDL
jgi:hypothetical protein